MSEILCDGCGRPAAPEHIAQRLRRLELATRFRPIHIDVLFLAEAPPARHEDYFYFVARDGAILRSQRTGPWENLFDGLLAGAGISREAGKSDADCLSEFQRRGLYLADAIECPVEEASSILPGDGPSLADRQAVLLRLAPTVIKRIQLSYKPRHIALISAGVAALIPLLEQAGLGERLELNNGHPFPFPESLSEAAEFRAGVAQAMSSMAVRAKGAC